MSRYRTATRILAEVIASDASWLMVFNGAIDHIIQNNPRARQNPRGLSQLDGYKRGLVNCLTGNLQKFGLDRAPRVKTWTSCFRTMKPARIQPRILQNRLTQRSIEPAVRGTAPTWRERLDRRRVQTLPKVSLSSVV